MEIEIQNGQILKEDIGEETELFDLEKTVRQMSEEDLRNLIIELAQKGATIANRQYLLWSLETNFWQVFRRGKGENATMVQLENSVKKQYQGINVYQNNAQQIQGRQVIEMNSIQPAAPVA